MFSRAAELLSPPRADSALPADYQSWLPILFPRHVTAPLAEHHHRLWQWVWELRRGVRPRPLCVFLARGGAKSTSAEMACVAVGARDARRYVLYVSGKQDQADDHVGNVARMLESPEIGEHYPRLGERSLGKYGHSHGWRRNRVRTAAGLTVDALGLDVAARGVKLDEQRPDLIIFDDVDDTEDSPLTIEKKVRSITQKLLPAGSPDLATLFVQNLVHHESVAARLAGLASETADFLADREVIGPVPALIGAEFEKQADGKWRITRGTPTWAGQNLETCQFQVHDWGIRAFRAEAQHERAAPVGQSFPEFDPSVHVVEPFPIPDGWPRWRAIDYGYAVPYCCHWLTRSPSGRIYVYREDYGSGWTALEQAMRVRTLSAGERYFVTVADPAMWGDTREGQRFRSNVSQYGEMGIELTQASNNRVAGWNRLHELLAWSEQAPPNLQVFKSCTNLIRTLPLLKRDPNKPEDVDSHVDQDDHCFVAGTLIATPDGDVPIERVRAGDLIMTRQGPRSVERAWMTNPDAAVITVTLSNGRTLTGTGNHPVWVDGSGWTRLDALRYGDILQTWQHDASRSSSTGSSTDATLIAPDSRTDPTTDRAATSDSGAATFCTGISGAITTAPSLTAGTSTTATAMSATMTRTTWSACQSETITGSGTLPSPVLAWKRPERSSLPAVNWLLRGTGQKLAAPGTANTEEPSSETDPIGRLPASSAANPSRPARLQPVGSARTPASPAGDGQPAMMTSSASAPTAGRHSQRTGTAASEAAPVSVVACFGGSSAPVYNLTVGETPEYFANGVLVHNCGDALRYGLMAAPWLDSLKREKPRGYRVGAGGRA